MLDKLSNEAFWGALAIIVPSIGYLFKYIIEFAAKTFVKSIEQPVKDLAERFDRLESLVRELIKGQAEGNAKHDVNADEIKDLRFDYKELQKQVHHIIFNCEKCKL